MEFTTIIMILFVIIGGYLLTTNQLEGAPQIVVTILVFILALIIILNLPIFNSYSEFVSSPVDATQPYSIPGSKYTATSTSYSLSTWIYINDWNVKYGSPKTIIQRTSNGQMNPQMYLDNNVNDLIIKFSTFDPTNKDNKSAQQTVKIENISIQKWVNITTCFGDKTVDTYINGKLVNTFVTDNIQYVQIQSSNTTNPDFSITPAGGFGGSIANTRYYDRFLTPQEAWDIYNKSFKSNFMNQFNASFTFYQNQNVKAQFYLL